MDGVLVKLKNRILSPNSWKGLRRDVIFNAVAATAIFALSDVVAQVAAPHLLKEKDKITSAEEPKKLDLVRTAAVASQGWFLNGILLTPFYRGLDVVFGSTYRPNPFFPGIPLKILATQIIYMPVATHIFLFATPFLETFLSYDTSSPHSLTKVKESFCNATTVANLQARSNFRSAYESSWMFWPLSDALNFRYIPVSFRPLWDSVVDIVWTAFLSHVAHIDHKIV